MSQNALRLYRKQLSRIIAEEIHDATDNGQTTDVDTVYERVVKRAQKLIDKLVRLLAAANVRSLIQHSLKRCVIPEGEVDAGAAEQLCFEGMDQFRDVPRMVTFEDQPGHVAYIRYLDTTIATRAAALQLVDHGIAADLQSRDALAAGNDFADELAAVYGDLPLHKLLELWRKGQELNRRRDQS